MPTISRRLGRLFIAGCLVAGLAVPSGPASADPPTFETGYIPVAVGTPDETTLHYKVMVPDPSVWGPGPYPAVIDYSGYLPAQNVYDGLDDRFVGLGYAVVGINMRGSGCSGGKFDYFEPRQAADGAEAIEWLATRPWSNGRFAMAGKSYPGITQLFVAAQQPDNLVAIVPGHVLGDLYRDVPYPGGIMNLTFAAGWSAQRLYEGYIAGPQWAISQDDEKCLENQKDHAPNVVYNPFVQALQNHFDGPLFQQRSPFYFADKIDVPTFLIESWQDEQVGSRATHLLERLRPGLPWRFLATNGDHEEYYGEEVFPHIVRFLDYHVKQVVPETDRREGETFEQALARYEAEDRVTINWENGAMGGRRSAWRETYATWPPPQQSPLRMWLKEDGTLQATPPEKKEFPSLNEFVNAALSEQYRYRYTPVVGSQARGGYGLVGPPLANWSERPPEGTYASFTSAPLDADKVLLGSASIDLWVTSTAADTDFEVTLSEVRPDDQEMFVQQGWLRASHRREDPELSTPLRPFQTHRLSDAAPLTAGLPTKVRIEIFPFGHVFRAGSRLRVTVAAPHLKPDLWGFAQIPVPAVNSIYTSGWYPSSIALPLIEGAAAEMPLPPCTLRNQPCRVEP